MIYSPVCNNPTKGFKNVDGCQVAIAGQGYEVTTVEESITDFEKQKGIDWMTGKKK